MPIPTLLLTSPPAGTCIAVGLYRFVKVLEYETANPGQDFNEKEAEVFTFDEDNAASAADVARPTVSVGHPDYLADRTGVSPTRDRDSASIDGATRLNSSRGAGVQDGNVNMHPGFQDSYAHAPDAEAGAIEGSYRPSSSSTRGAPQLPGPVH